VNQLTLAVSHSKIGSRRLKARLPVWLCRHGMLTIYKLLALARAVNHPEAPAISIHKGHRKATNRCNATLL
jgi:hypothetical protein